MGGSCVKSTILYEHQKHYCLDNIEFLDITRRLMEPITIFCKSAHSDT